MGLVKKIKAKIPEIIILLELGRKELIKRKFVNRGNLKNRSITFK